jgi:hypothetical protein
MNNSFSSKYYSPVNIAAKSLDFKWSLLLLVTLVDLVWLVAGGWRLELHSLLRPGLLAVIMVVPLVVSRYRADDKIRAASDAVVYSIAITTSGGMLSYMVVSTNFPLVDSTLSTMDQWLGFSWQAYYRWTAGHPLYFRVIDWAYESLFVQTWGILLYLSFTKRFSRVTEYLELFATLMLVTIAVSLVFPAAGASKFYAADVHADVSGLSHFELLRSGAMRYINLDTMQGLISIPSFHTILALLFCWAVRRTWLAALIIPLNVALLLSTPVVGGHYLVDLIAGAGVTVAGIAIRSGCRRVAGVQLRSGDRSIA